MKRNDYVGKISNSGAQKVIAPQQNNTNKGKPVVQTGTDLRSGKKNNK